MKSFLLVAAWGLLVLGMVVGQNTTKDPSSSGGISKQVIGGSQASNGQFKWQASIWIQTGSVSTVGRHCGGSLIDSKWVLTAAHCFIAPYTTVKVWFASTTAQAGTPAPVDSVIKHPAFNPTTLYTDIALVKLVTAILPTNQNIQRIPLVPDGVLCPFRQANNYVVGWGTSGTPPLTQNLRYVTVASYNPLDCFLQVTPTSGHNAAALPMTHICSVPGTNSPCVGDDGGAMVEISGAANPQVLYQVGVVSIFRMTCGASGASAYTRVDMFRPWLRATTGNVNL